MLDIIQCVLGSLYWWPSLPESGILGQYCSLNEHLGNSAVLFSGNSPVNGLWHVKGGERVLRFQRKANSSKAHGNLFDAFSAERAL